MTMAQAIIILQNPRGYTLAQQWQAMTVIKMNMFAR